MEEGFPSTEDKSPQLTDGTGYRSLVGALLYISICARPDVAASVAILGRNVSSPTEADWVTAKRVVRYLNSTKEWKLTYSDTGGELIGYTNADWAGDAAIRKSTTGFVFQYAGAAVSWVSRRQSCVTLSSMESEYVALSEASQELIWLRNLLKDMCEQQSDPVKVMEDNQSCIQFGKEESSERKNRRFGKEESSVCAWTFREAAV
ncbi:uncharacterized protein LOC129766025 [Toxorhynchites rutilus septentrionalis]|uniref:uncharacterized protein LOC129766025 n=1 Tax=Toxorhynchites rutilus septentrionalis TaxID=329112 RepID=UPI00247A9416|nr:uncharacterized protein LOC129766025 [Toxorhynchites rutilus septentrionalis]